MEKVKVVVKENLETKNLLKKVLEPEVENFSQVFQKKSGTPLTGMEKEVLKAYLFHKIKNNG